MRHWRSALSAGLVASLATALLAVAPASAASYPNYTYSVYMTSMSGSTAQTEGCYLGQAVGNGSRPSNAIVVLDFGYPIEEGGTWGTLLNTSGYPFESTSTIAAVVEDYGAGYYDCSPSGTTLRIGIGENSSDVDINGTHYNYFTGADGTAWAGLVNSVNSWFSTYPHNYASQVSAGGAADIENASLWAPFSNAAAWNQSFSAATSYAYYDFGSANGCSYANTYANNPCNAGWNTYDEWYVSWHGVAYPLPIDYNQTYWCAAQGCGYGDVDANSRQWEAISRYGAHYQGGPLYIEGPVTQYEACIQHGGCSGVDNTPAVGGTDTYNALNHDYAPGETAENLQWATDFEWGYAKV